MHNNKYIIFALTSWSYGALEGTASAFAMTKQHMASDLKLKQSFFGITDCVTIIGTIVGTFLMVNLTKNIRRNFLIFSIIHSIFFSMLTFSEYVPIQVGKVVIVACMFICGIAKASVVFPQILFTNFFDTTTQRFYFNLWYGLTFLGDTFGILLSKAIIRNLQLGWQSNIYFFSFILCLVTILIYCFIDDPPSQNDQEKETIYEILANIKEFLEPTANKLITADFALQEVLYNNIILWMPYSFELNNLQGEDYIATLSFPVMIAFGALVIEYPLTFCEQRSKYYLNLMIMFATFLFFAMVILPLNEDNVTAHIIFLATAGFMMGAPYSRVCSGDPAQVCEGDPKKIHTAFFTINFVRYICSAISFLMIGKLLESQKDALQRLNFISIFLVLIVGITRRFFFPPLANSNNNQIEENKEDLQCSSKDVK